MSPPVAWVVTDAAGVQQLRTDDKRLALATMAGHPGWQLLAVR